MAKHLQVIIASNQLTLKGFSSFESKKMLKLALLIGQIWKGRVSFYL